MVFAPGSYGAKVEEVMKAQGIKGTKLSHLLGLERSAFSTWKRNGEIPLKHKDGIEENLGVSREFLEGRTDEETYTDWRWSQAGQKLKPKSRECLIEFIDSLETDAD